MHTRRHFLQRGIAFSAGFAGLAMLSRERNAAFASLVEDVARSGIGYGPLVKDALGVLDLPAGFTYSVVSRRGDVMADGLFMPGQPDGMASFPGPEGLTLIVCNHELEAGSAKRGPFGEQNELLGKVDPSKLFDIGSKRPSLGGCTTIVYDTKSQRKIREFASLLGTNRNCAGGPTPWGSWLTCEEDVANKGDEGALRNHGYVFEVPASAEMKLTDAVPIREMGRFKHEAVALDPRTGTVYLTEDIEHGLIYRFTPKEPGKLYKGGKLEAMMWRAKPGLDTSNRKAGSDVIGVGTKIEVEWVALENVDRDTDDLRVDGFRAGAMRFARGEGMWWGHDSVYFAATTGGVAQKGQIWRYMPDASNAAKGVLELFVEPNDGHLIENADNLTVSPWGDLIVCEDSVGGDVEPGNRLVGITKDGQPYVFARNAASESEFAGVNFSPDGTTMFVNIQGNGLTLAIMGPWRT
ncbi:dTDP-glucose 4,6-dehydratase [Phycisphaerae bacterium]|jgi:secreted PhoX family phosphatase|nr:dTDP-glucose 4,6-dehydratase [Phycisphaerae bacterium]